MAIASQVSRWEYVPDGVTATYGFDNVVFEPDDIKVYVAGALKVREVDYTIAINPDGTGAITFLPGKIPAAPVVPGTKDVVLDRDVPLTQAKQFPRVSAFPAEDVAQALDRLTVIAQQLALKLLRTFRLAPGDPAVDLTLPLLAARAERILGFDADGKPVAVAQTSLLAVETATLNPGEPATAEYDPETGLLALGIPQGDVGPQGDPGNDGADGVFSAIASQGDAETGTDNVKGMTALRVVQSIAYQLANAWAAIAPSGSVIGRARAAQSAGQSTTASLGIGSVATDAQGTQVVSLVYNKKRAGSYLRVRFVVPILDCNANTVGMAIFITGSANARAQGASAVHSAADFPAGHVLEWEGVVNATGNLTVQARFGNTNGSATIYIGRTSAISGIAGQVCALFVEEIKE